MVVKSVQKTLRLTTLSKQVEEIVNPACGDHPAHQMGFMCLWGHLKAFLVAATQQESSLKSMYGEAIPPPKKSTLVTQMTVPIRFH